MLRWTEDGVEYEPDQRHAEIIIKRMGVQKSKPLATPCANEDKDVVNIRSKSKVLLGKEATEYRALAARLNYLALDRLDIQYVAKCVSKYMASPCEHDWLALKRRSTLWEGLGVCSCSDGRQCQPTSLPTVAVAGPETARRENRPAVD